MIETEAQRARRALTRVRAVPKERWSEYRTLALKLPVLVHLYGADAALHFLAARRNSRERKAAQGLLDDLAADLEFSDRGQLLGLLRSARDDEEREVALRIGRQLAWYKRMVQAAGRDGGDPAGGADASAQ